MLMVRAIVRPEKEEEILSALLESGYSSVTKWDVYGRGKQKGIQLGDVFYDELPKVMILMIIHDADEEEVKKIIINHARTGTEGNSGDGRIFISPVDEAYTISSQTEGL